MLVDLFGRERSVGRDDVQAGGLLDGEMTGMIYSVQSRGGSVRADDDHSVHRACPNRRPHTPD